MVKNGNKRVPERQRDVSECERDVLGKSWLCICFIIDQVANHILERFTAFVSPRLGCTSRQFVYSYLWLTKVVELFVDRYGI